MLDKEHLVFIVDMNELQAGDLIPIAMDFTVNRGPFVFADMLDAPNVGDCVRIHYDEDNVLYYGEVVEQTSKRDFLVRIMWDTGVPVLNKEWSVASEHAPATVSSPYQSATTGDKR